jgi:hypothetical protein
MKNILHLFFLFSFLFSRMICYGAEPKPLLVIIERNPWLDVIGSDSPTFALYEDGTLVYLPEKPVDGPTFLSKKIVDPQKAANAFLGFDPGKMQREYQLTYSTDQPSTTIWTPAKRIFIYGKWRTKTEYPLLAEIRAALVKIDQQRATTGTTWLPPKIEVMLWPYEYAPDSSINWPNDWPNLTSKDTLERKKGNYSVFLPTAKLPDLQKFLANQKPKGAIFIDGRKMAASYRFPFPGEAAWMK